jgi:hypothetical protein
MHSVCRSLLGAPREKFLTFDCTGNDITYNWVFFGQFGSEVHLFPTGHLINKFWEGGEINRNLTI